MEVGKSIKNKSYDNLYQSVWGLTKHSVNNSIWWAVSRFVWDSVSNSVVDSILGDGNR